MPTSAIAPLANNIQGRVKIITLVQLSLFYSKLHTYNSNKFCKQNTSLYQAILRKIDTVEHETNTIIFPSLFVLLIVCWLSFLDIVCLNL